MLIREVMHPDPITIAPDVSLSKAYSLMNRENIRHLPVLESGKLVGIVTDRDLRLATSKLAEHPFDPQVEIREVMSHPVRTTHSNDPVEMATQIMRELKIGCLPVVDETVLVGIVTNADLLDAMLRLTGVHLPSGRLDIGMPDRPGELARLTKIIADRNINIHSILTYSEAGKRMRMVLRVNTMEIHALAKDICEAGFEILWPPHIICVK